MIKKYVDTYIYTLYWFIKTKKTHWRENLDRAVSLFVVIVFFLLASCFSVINGILELRTTLKGFEFPLSIIAIWCSIKLEKIYQRKVWRHEKEIEANYTNTKGWLAFLLLPLSIVMFFITMIWAYPPL